MTESDWSIIRRGKAAHRLLRAALPFGEKLEILERLRERDETFRELRARQNVSGMVAAKSNVYTLDPHPPSGVLRIVTSFGANDALVSVAAASPPLQGHPTPIQEYADKRI